MLLARAKELRASLGGGDSDARVVTPAVAPDFTLPPMPNTFRLYLDVGRETGTWMDPRWGASGRRVECTIDVSFGDVYDAAAATAEACVELKKCLATSASTPPRKMRTAPFARLRGGFDKMQLIDGGFCIEDPGKGSSTSTLRLCIEVGGASEGDVTIPRGFLFFALPCFGFRQVGSSSSSMMTLSNKAGTICVRQMGWHTGWRREESRILGVFRAVEIEKARLLDKF